MPNTIAASLGELLIVSKCRLAVAESLTAGRVQAMMGSVSGASNFFEGGLTAYNLHQKVAQLGIDRQVAEDSNCVSEQIAAEMVVGVCRLFSCECGISTTGYAEPDASRNVLTPFAFIGMKIPSAPAPIVIRVEATGNREKVQSYVATEAVRRFHELLSQSESTS